MCVCVCEREREREGAAIRGESKGGTGEERVLGPFERQRAELKRQRGGIASQCVQAAPVKETCGSRGLKPRQF